MLTLKTESYSFLVIDTTLVWDNPLHFRKNLLEKNIKNNHENWWKDQNLKGQYDNNREAVKISMLSAGKLVKDEYITVEGILPSDQRSVVEQANFTYCPLRKALEKQTKTIEDQQKNQ